MMSYISSAILFSSILLSTTATAAPEKTVTFEGAIQPTASAATGHFTLSVQMDIKEGWHTYGEVGEGSEVRTALELKLPKGAKTNGTWKRPAGVEGAESHSEIYTGKVSFTKNLVLDPTAYGKNIEVVVSYQACNEEACNPPQTKTISIAIPENVSTRPNSQNIFESPVRLSVDGAPLNALAKKRFPSPGIFDVDDDGKAELVVGSLMGSVGVYENLNSSETGDPVWSSREALKDSKGKQIRTSNW